MKIRAAITAGFLLASTFALGANKPIPTGEIVDGIAAASDPSQTYAIYLPKSYSPEKPAPLLLIFDPRSRGAFAAKLFVPAAEKFGFVLASSNGTRSDTTDIESNRRAVAAVWNDVFNHAKIDARRIYATGFSGGARISADLAARGRLAGVIAVGAGFPIGESPSAQTSFLFYGIVGNRDFNYTEMTRLDRQLEELGLRHRLHVFEGGHTWSSPEALTAAVEWLEIEAMKKELRPLDETLIRSAFERRTAEAAAQESAKDLPAALREWRAAAADFKGLIETASAREAVKRLESDREVRRAVEREQNLEKAELAARQKDLQIVTNLLSPQNPTVPSLSTALSQSGIKSLKSTAERGTGWERDSAGRRLEALFAHTSFYLFEGLLQARQSERALLSISLANEIKPGLPFVLYNVAALSARVGRADAAVDALNRAVDNGFRDAKLLDGDDDFAAVRKDPRFAAVRARLQ
jgi:predicted esterase